MKGQRKRLVMLVAAVGACVVAAGVAGARTQATLHIYGYGPGDDVAGSLINFTKERLGSGTTIDNPAGGFDDQAFLARLASGDAPDIVWMDRGRVGTYAAKGALQTFDNCIKSQKINMKQYRSAARQEVTYKGHVYGLPAFTNQITIMVNDSAVKSAGLKPSDVSTKNWGRLMQVTKKLVKFDSSGKLTRIGFDPKIPEFFPLWVKWFGKGNAGKVISDDGLHARLNTPNAVKALTYTVSLINAQGGWNKFKSFRDTFDFFGAQNPFVKDQLAASPYESFIYNVFANNSPNEPLSANYFTNRNGGPITMFSGNAWVMPKGAKDSADACKWAKLMTSVPAWINAAKNRSNLRKARGQAFTGLFTANTTADLRIFQGVIEPSTKSPWYNPIVQRLYRAPRFAFALPVSPGSQELRQAITDAVNRVLNGQQSPQQALKQAQREAQAAINKNK